MYFAFMDPFHQNNKCSCSKILQRAGNNDTSNIDTAGFALVTGGPDTNIWPNTVKLVETTGESSKIKESKT